MFRNRHQHYSFVLLAVGLCTFGAYLITLSLFHEYVNMETDYRPMALSCAGAAFLVIGLAAWGYVRYRQSH